MRLLLRRATRAGRHGLRLALSVGHHTGSQFGPRFIIDDVKDKGLDAVGRRAAVLAVFREVAFGEADLVDLAASMDARLALALPDLGAAVKRVVRLLLELNLRRPRRGRPARPLRVAGRPAGAMSTQRSQSSSSSFSRSGASSGTQWLGSGISS